MFFERRGAGASAAGLGPRGVGAVEEDVSEELAVDELPLLLEPGPRRVGVVALVLVEPALSELAPAEPFVSANASGIAAAAEPIPSATANAPMRPTNRAEFDDGVTTRRPYSIGLIDINAERRCRPRSEIRSAIASFMKVETGSEPVPADADFE